MTERFQMLDQSRYPGWGVEGACSGECCRLMTLSASPEIVALLAAGTRYQERIAASHRLSAEWHDSKLLPVPNVRANPDAVFVERHWIPVRLSFHDGISGRLRRRSPEPEMQYRCAQWDGTTKRCRDYESRPDLCRTHGVENRCEGKGCTLRPYFITPDIDRWCNEGGLAAAAPDWPEPRDLRIAYSSPEVPS